MNLESALIRIYPVLITALFAFVLVFALYRYFLCAFGLRPGTRFLRAACMHPLRARRDTHKGLLTVALHIAAAFLLSRAVMWLIGYLGSVRLGLGSAYLTDQERLFSQWDASHYLGIAEFGYRTTGDARLHIVFYPLYPFLVRVFTFGFLPYLVSAMLVSNLCLLIAAFLLYLVVRDCYGEKIALTSVRLFLFCPAAAFYSIPYTESLFVCLTLAALYFARKRKFAVSLVFASLSAFTRLPGIASAVFVFFEMLRKRLPQIMRGANRSLRRKEALIHFLKSFLLCFVILSGFAAYLIVNKAVTGNAFQFLEYQKNHWGQDAGTLFETARYSIRYAFNPFQEWYRFGVYVPQCAIILLVMALLALSVKRLHPGDLAYSVVYAYIILIPTMLISGPRYLSALYALYPMAALFSRRNAFTKVLVYFLFGAFYLYGAYMFFVKRTYL